MTREQARSILRIIGIVTVLIGAIMTAQALFAWAKFPDEVIFSGVGRYVPVEGMGGDVPSLTVMSNSLIIVFGVLLCALSSTLARLVVGRLPSN